MREKHPYLDDIAQAFIDSKKAEGRKSTWLKPFASMVQAHFYPTYSQHTAKDLTYSGIVSVITTNYAEHSLTTRSRYLSYLKIMFQFAVPHGYLHLKTFADVLEKRLESRNDPVEGLLEIIRHHAEVSADDDRVTRTVAHELTGGSPRMPPAVVSQCPRLRGHGQPHSRRHRLRPPAKGQSDPGAPSACRSDFRQRDQPTIKASAFRP